VPPTRCSSFRVVSPITSRSRWERASARPATSSPAGRTFRTRKDRWNGRWPGRCGATALPPIIATPSRRPTGARMRTVCGRR
jgi:hypothetical protein